MSRRKIDNLRHNSDEMVSKVDEQALRNFELNLELNNYKSELVHALNRVNEHSYCPGQVNIDCMDKKPHDHYQCESNNQPQQPIQPTVVHGEDCHCSKCCPNPRPNFFQKNKFAILVSILWMALIVLAIGWSPSGATFEAIQTSYVDLLVNFFKMSIFAVAGFVTYQLMKRKDD